MTDSERALVQWLTPEEVIAYTLWAEARGASVALRTAIACVIQNRAAAQRPVWGLTPQDVCLEPGQFSCWSSAGGSANHAELMAAVAATVDKQQPPGPILRECLALAWQVTGGTLPDTTNGALFYFSPAAMIPRGRVPSWAKGKQPTTVVDGTQFFTDGATA